uniref:Rhombotin-1 n=1 Tax=Sparus aurata TaxID=8175 RepID=A0A7L9QAH0_SPAAU|nr:rhombotin-1 [Sparus aurata]
MVLDKEESVSLVSLQSREKPAGLRRLQQEDPRPLHAAGVGQVLARGLPEVCLLRLPPGKAGLHSLTRANLILCRRDYLRLFGVTGNCAACSKLIPAFEMVMRARDNVYHLDCFACQLCRQRFCVGDKFFLKNNMILCQLDYEGGHLNGSAERQPQ